MVIVTIHSQCELSNSLENVDEGLVHSEQNVYTEYADPRRREWITKIEPTLKKSLPYARLSKRVGNDYRHGRLSN